jgi:hypothetical protein
VDSLQQQRMAEAQGRFAGEQSGRGQVVGQQLDLRRREAG